MKLKTKYLNNVLTALLLLAFLIADILITKNSG